MYKNVIAIGDSFMEGAEISWPLPDKENVVGAQLAQHWNCDFYNLAQSGAGILSVLEQLKFAEQSGVIGPDSYVIYSLPPSGRIDFPFVSDKIEAFVVDYWYHKKILDGTFDQPLPPDIESNPTYVRFKKFYEGLGPDIDLVKMGEQIHYSGVAALFGLLSKYPNRIGIIGHPQHCLDSYYRTELYRLMDQEKLMFVKHGFAGWANHNKYTIMPYGHPGADAHRALAKLILNEDTI